MKVIYLAEILTTMYFCSEFLSLQQCISATTLFWILNEGWEMIEVFVFKFSIVELYFPLILDSLHLSLA